LLCPQHPGLEAKREMIYTYKTATDFVLHMQNGGYGKRRSQLSGTIFSFLSLPYKNCNCFRQKEKQEKGSPVKVAPQSQMERGIGPGRMAIPDLTKK
jgi:hypothetical protein